MLLQFLLNYQFCSFFFFCCLPFSPSRAISWKKNFYICYTIHSMHSHWYGWITYEILPIPWVFNLILFHFRLFKLNLSFILRVLQRSTCKYIHVCVCEGFFRFFFFVFVILHSWQHFICLSNQLTFSFSLNESSLLNTLLCVAFRQFIYYSLSCYKRFSVLLHHHHYPAAPAPIVYLHNFSAVLRRLLLYIPIIMLQFVTNCVAHTCG